MYLCLDVGTHSARAALMTEQGQTVYQVGVPLGIKRSSLKGGARVCVEQDPVEVVAALASVAQKASQHAKLPITRAGLSCQRSTVLAWLPSNRTPLSPLISWQDTRGRAHVDSLRAHAETIYQITGLVLSPHYGASKIHWLQQGATLPAEAVTTPLVSYLIACLNASDAVLCDETNAARTQLWRLQSTALGQWDASLLNLFGVDATKLPEVLPTFGDYGCLAGVGLPEVPLQAVMGDQNAAVMGVLTPSSHEALINCGTGAFVLGFAQGAKPEAYRGLLTSVATSNVHERHWVYEGTINGAGAAFRWLAEQPSVMAAASAQSAERAEQWLFENLPEWLRTTNTLPGCFLNTVGGLGSPYWSSGELPVFTGTGWTVAEQAVAVTESIAFLVAKNIAALDAYQFRSQLIFSGGLSRLEGLAQKVADLTGRPCVLLDDFDTTLLGTAVVLSEGTLVPSNVLRTRLEPKENAELIERANTFYHQLESMIGYPKTPT